WDNNVCGTLALLAAMREAGVPRMVFSSTAATYGEPDVNPITEDVPAVPINPYGQSKLAVDYMLAGAVPAGRRPSVEVYGTDYPTPDGTAVRDYLHVVDLGEAHLAALQAVQPGQH